MNQTLEEQVKTLAMSRLDSVGSGGGSRAGNIAYQQPSQPRDASPTISHWLEDIKALLTELEHLVSRSERVSEKLSGQNHIGESKSPAPVTSDSIVGACESVRHRLALATNRIRSALDTSESVIGGQS